MTKLAIVIPVYKIIFFDQALASIAKQTCKDFTLYIGNDASPSDIKSIVDLYQDQISIKYTEFKDNIGGTDLVSHWERCINLAGEEEWIWLFSDDDIMEPTCVADFLKTVEKYPDFDLFHFNILKIDELNNITDKFFPYPEIYSIENFLIGRLKGEVRSCVVEYIFRKSHFIDINRFHNLDLAWGSDDATWIKLGRNKGIRTIEHSTVYWRESRFNISPNETEGLLKRKLDAQIHFARWVLSEIENKRININKKYISKLLLDWQFTSIKYKVQFLSFKTIGKFFYNSCVLLNGNKHLFGKMVYLFSYKIYCFFKFKYKEIVK